MDTNSRFTPIIDIHNWVDYDWLVQREGRSAEILGKSEQRGKVNTDEQGLLRVGPDYISLKDVLAIYPRSGRARPLYCEVVQL